MAESLNETRMTLGEHFEELRRALLRAVLGVGLGMVICLIFGQHIMQLMCWPVAVALRATQTPVRLRALAPAESFSVYLRVCIIWGAILASPYSLHQLWRFIAAGLYAHERRYVQRIVPFSAVLFLAGVVFFFVIVAPLVLMFFVNFSRSNFPLPTWASPLDLLEHPPAATQPADAPPTLMPVFDTDPSSPAEGQVWLNRRLNRLRVFVDGQVRDVELSHTTFLTTEWTLASYMSFVSLLSLVFGLGFQVPVVVLVLARTHLVSLARLSAVRKYVVLAILIIAGLLTPPDVTSQIALAVPMYLLYELGLLLARRGQPKPPREPEERKEKESPWL